MESMIDKVFLDTNILVYCFDGTVPHKKQVAVDLVSELWGTGRGILSLQILKEFFVTVTQKLSVKIDYADARRAVEDFLTWDITQEDRKSMILAMDVARRYQLSFWDANVIVSALLSDCRLCYSEDLNSGQVFDGLKIVNPFL